jgi:ankyrin repeat protein
MSLQDENKMLYILHRNGVSREHIKWIMNDLKESNTFCDNDEEEYDDADWEFLEEQAYWLFDSGVSNSEKIEALRIIKVKQEEYEKTKKCQYSLDQEKRIQAKIQEMIEKGLREPDDPKPVSEKRKNKSITRYGRSPLHEAVAMRDIRLIKKYLKMGKYLDEIDNNGHTAMEMAFYDNYKEALILFEKYEKKKKIA